MKLTDFARQLPRRSGSCLRRCCLFQGLGQRLGSTQDHGRPELRQGVKCPVPLPFRGPGLLKDRPTQTRAQMVVHTCTVPGNSTRVSWGSGLAILCLPYKG